MNDDEGCEVNKKLNWYIEASEVRNVCTTCMQEMNDKKETNNNNKYTIQLIIAP